MRKRNNIIISIIVFVNTLLIGQNNQISLSSGYSNQSFFSMQNGEVLNVNNSDWDMAFSTDAFSSTIRINDGKGVELYTYHLGDTSSWGSINNNTINILINPMYNSDSDWGYGAFDTNQIGGFDYGWGIYNLQTHHIIGDSLFLIKTVSGNWKKLWLEKKVSGKYLFKYANLDGTNEISDSILASNYNTKRFIYFSLDNNMVIDREPILSDWDITFTKYITPVQGMPYSVTGVLCNSGIEVAEADGISNPFSYTDYDSHNFENNINSIGYDWKTFQGSYVLDSDRCFFVRDYQQNIWRIVFTSFDGMSTGNIEFNTELISTSSTNNFNTDKTFSIYPNPSSTNQSITLVYDMNNKDGNLSVCDITGREIYNSKIDSKGLKLHTIPSNIIERGTYIISLNSNGEVLKKKVIIH
jgi:hypothetical protein